SFWTSFALNSAGDLENSRAAIGFVAKFQRDDGKIPHEIPQSASFIPWFRQFPYGYNAADASPLFAVAVRDYVQASGDLEFARLQAPRLWKALDFMRSTLDRDGFPANLGVGPGWVEGGPLLPVRLELYQAGCYVESLRALASIARLLKDEDRARQLDAEFAQKRAAMDKLFWNPKLRSYAFAVSPRDQLVDEESVLATVPMWFHLLDDGQAQQMLESLAEEKNSTDWGMRIISSSSPLYDPSGYHFGSVWPLFTGWAAVAEYQYHHPRQALANLEANAALALSASGNTTEVLSGATATPLSTASPHQIWSAAMVVSPLLRGLAGIEMDAVQNRLHFAPHLPANWPSFAASGIRTSAGTLNLQLKRDRDTLNLIVTNTGAAPVDIDFAPSYPPCARILSAQVGKVAAIWKSEVQPTDFHPRFAFSANSGTTELRIRHAGIFDYSVPLSPPRLAKSSTNLRVLSERWSNQRDTLTLSVSGLAGEDYLLNTVGSDQIQAISGASRDGAGNLLFKMPAGDTGKYVRHSITIRLR
ncbi:MAG TPA: hypothetical protein VNH18_23435, partial [Bryobacteraceae bacterium]|nr:hypothetical protein [Bryobacteraceae bacterium]